jgi:peptide/nickel transport system substrate-binding protein
VAATLAAVSARLIGDLTQPVVNYRVALVADRLPLSLDPLVDATDPAVAAMSPLLYRSLLRLDASASPVPDLAAGMTTSLDGLTYRLTLRSGLHWSDGTALTLQDVLATIDWVQSHGFPGTSLASAWNGVDATVSGATLTLSLATPRASFPVTMSQLPILPLGTMTHAAVARLASESGTPLATSGPYEVAGTNSSAITLVSNPYADARPRMGRVAVLPMGSFAAAAAAFAAGSVDAVLATTPAERAQLLRRSGSVAEDVTTFGFVELIFNERVQGLSDPVVRSAVNEAIDRTQIISGPLEGLGVPQYGPIPAGILWLGKATASALPNPQAAGAALTADGWAVGANGDRSRNGVALSFTLSVPDAAPLPQVATGVASQLDALGIATTVAIVPSGQFLSGVLLSAAFQLALAGWDNGADPDVSSYWLSTATPPAGFNVSGGPVDAFLDQDLTALATAGSVSQSTAAAVRVAADLAADVPAVFLYAPQESLVVSRTLARAVVTEVGSPFGDAAAW